MTKLQISEIFLTTLLFRPNPYLHIQPMLKLIENPDDISFNELGDVSYEPPELESAPELL